jgi:predicted nucleic acid-binding protein
MIALPVRRLRLFLDANVLISAAWKDSSKVARIWHIHGIQLITSEYVLNECHRNPPFSHQQQRLDRLLLSVRIVPFPAGAQIEDPPGDLPSKDQPVLAAAVFARADFLVTGDIRHFGKWYGSSVMGVRIEPPGSFPEILDTGNAHPGY